MCTHAHSAWVCVCAGACVCVGVCAFVSSAFPMGANSPFFADLSDAQAWLCPEVRIAWRCCDLCATGAGSSRSKCTRSRWITGTSSLLLWHKQGRRCREGCTTTGAPAGPYVAVSMNFTVWGERGGRSGAAYRLRPESADEAKRVQLWSRSLGIEHSILTLQWSEAPTTRVMQTARQRRYEILVCPPADPWMCGSVSTCG